MKLKMIYQIIGVFILASASHYAAACSAGDMAKLNEIAKQDLVLISTMSALSSKCAYNAQAVGATDALKTEPCEELFNKQNEINESTSELRSIDITKCDYNYLSGEFHEYFRHLETYNKNISLIIEHR